MSEYIGQLSATWMLWCGHEVIDVMGNGRIVENVELGYHELLTVSSNAQRGLRTTCPCSYMSAWGNLIGQNKYIGRWLEIQQKVKRNKVGV